jgi:site-specific DNA-methyltransferase (adenine-specific)
MIEYKTNTLDLRLMDCMDLMREFPDKHFDLAIVDPPYGINVAEMNLGAGNSPRCSKIENRKWEAKSWDSSPPPQEYFDELFRVSENQIIWGGNYFNLPPSQYFAIWDKGEGMRGRSFAEAEYAWARSGGTRLKQINPVDRERIHPTQKPSDLYRWLIANYAKEGMKILDTHLGSMSHAIAAHYSGVHLTGCELDPDYFAAGIARVKAETAQMDMFADVPKEKQTETMKLL